MGHSSRHPRHPRAAVSGVTPPHIRCKRHKHTYNMAKRKQANVRVLALEGHKLLYLIRCGLDWLGGLLRVSRVLSSGDTLLCCSAEWLWLWVGVRLEWSRRAH